MSEILHDFVTKDPEVTSEHKVVLNTKLVWKQVAVFNSRAVVLFGRLPQICDIGLAPHPLLTKYFM